MQSVAAIHSCNIGLRPSHEEILLKLGVLKRREGIGGAAAAAQGSASYTSLQAHKCKQQQHQQWHGVGESHGLGSFSQRWDDNSVEGKRKLRRLSSQLTSHLDATLSS